MDESRQRRGFTTSARVDKRARSAWPRGSFPRSLFAEFVGTFFLVLVGCGAIAADVASPSRGIGPVGVSLAFGLVVAIQVYALGHVSGAHFNPAITIGLASARRFPWKKVPGYVAAQLFGATLAGFLLVMIFGSAADATTTHETVPVHIAILVEVLATFLLAFVISAVATDRRAPVSVGGLSIGFAVAADSLAFGGLTGASMNPARSMGPALAVGDLVGLWLYVVAPLAGAILGAWSYEFCRGRSSDADFEAAYTSKPGQDQSPDAGFD